MTQKNISPHKVTLILLMAIVVAVLVSVFLWVWTDVEPVRSPFLNIEELPSTQIQSVNDINAVLARPLFWYQRQPNKELQVIVEDEKESVVSPLMEIVLLGIILNEDMRTALLSVEGKIVSVQAGQAIQSWTVDRVTAKEVVFVAGKEETTLSLVREIPASIQIETIK